MKSRKNEILREELHIGVQYSSVLQSFVLASTYRLPPSNHMVFHRPWPRSFKLLGPVDDLAPSGLDVCRPTPYSPRRHISNHTTMPVRRRPPKSSHVIWHPARCHSAETVYRLSVERPHRGFFSSMILISVNRRLVFLPFRCAAPVFKCPIFPLPLRDGSIQRKAAPFLPLYGYRESFSFRCAAYISGESYSNRISLFYTPALLWLCRAAGLRVDEFHIDFLRLHLCNEAD
ncbi:hypothetical protein C8F04DRAFT_1079748 [Mycena alexandri]|uniref:Uncharacterized protein n=1 Tax=Mycena alexandri TaxID=1745969 RepID=A0AAD6X971_9AGAR|nr:hypothetical protein C8F04DRAFT_1079748 [Mycena alexandri]